MKTISVVILGLISASALTACSTTPHVPRYASDPCNPYACAPRPAPVQNPCCYPQPVMYAPAPVQIAPAPMAVAPPVYVEPEIPAPVYIEPPAYVPPPVIAYGYPEPPVPIPHPLPIRK